MVEKRRVGGTRLELATVESLAEQVGQFLKL